MLAAEHWFRAARIAGAVMAIAWMMPVLTHGQAAKPAAQGAAKLAAANPANWSVPRTPWGDPDFQGIWDIAGGPAQAEGSLPPEIAERLVKARQSRYDPTDKRGMQTSQLSKAKGKVVDPPDGLFPMLPGKWIYYDPRPRGDHWRNHKVTERCITGGVPDIYLGGDVQRIIQSPGWVVMLTENIHDVRAIPTNGRPHVGADIRLWNGDSRGRWEGDTLVVDITNFNDKGQVVSELGGALNNSSQLHVVERWTRVAQDAIKQELTVTDPSVFSRPWTAVVEHKLEGPGFFIVEYACHEGNWNYMSGSLRQGRVREQKAAQGGAASGR